MTKWLHFLFVEHTNNMMYLMSLKSSQQQRFFFYIKGTNNKLSVIRTTGPLLDLFALSVLLS